MIGIGLVAVSIAFWVSSRPATPWWLAWSMPLAFVPVGVLARASAGAEDRGLATGEVILVEFLVIVAVLVGRSRWRHREEGDGY